MVNKRKWFVILFVIVAIAVATGTAFADDNIGTVLSYDKETDTYKINVGGKIVNVVTLQMHMLVLNDLDVANAVAADYKKTIDALGKPINRIEEVLKTKNEYIQGLEEQIKLYEQLVEKYKRLKSDSWLRFELAGGFTANFNLAVLGGISMFNVSILGFIQNNNPGCFIGLNIPIL